MVDLQQPDYAYYRGEVRPWEGATIHVDSEAAKRGLNVFEGLKGYWSADGARFALVALPRHYARLRRSARILRVPCPWSLDEFRTACTELMEEMLTPEKDMWVRPTLFVVDGHWGQEDESDLMVTAFHQEKKRPEPVDVGVSTWQKAHDLTLPPRVKSGTNYQIGRLARIEGREQGYSEMLLLNRAGRVSESTSSCVLVVRDGTVVTPPASEGVLESITVDVVEALCESLDIPFERRPVDRTELYVADEAALAGTLSELVTIRSVDGVELPAESPLLDAVTDRFWKAARDVEPHPAVDLTVVAEREALAERREAL